MLTKQDIDLLKWLKSQTVFSNPSIRKPIGNNQWQRFTLDNNNNIIEGYVGNFEEI